MRIEEKKTMIDQRQATMWEAVASKWSLRLAAVLLLSWSIIIGLSLLFNFRQTNQTAVLAAQEEQGRDMTKMSSIVYGTPLTAGSMPR